VLDDGVRDVVADLKVASLQQASPSQRPREHDAGRVARIGTPGVGRAVVRAVLPDDGDRVRAAAQVGREIEFRRV
jgi:hypothetical protein